MRNIVIEHKIEAANGRTAKAKIVAGDLWGDDFDNLCGKKGCTYVQEGLDSEMNMRVMFHQTFLKTDLTDEELLQIFI